MTFNLQQLQQQQQQRQQQLMKCLEFTIQKFNFRTKY
jgi:hypothetical protein